MPFLTRPLPVGTLRRARPQVFASPRHAALGDRATCRKLEPLQNKKPYQLRHSCARIQHSSLRNREPTLVLRQSHAIREGHAVRTGPRANAWNVKSAVCSCCSHKATEAGVTMRVYRRPRSTCEQRHCDVAILLQSCAHVHCQYWSLLRQKGRPWKARWPSGMVFCEKHGFNWVKSGRKESPFSSITHLSTWHLRSRHKFQVPELLSTQMVLVGRCWTSP